MAIAVSKKRRQRKDVELHNGDRMSQKEFHRLYQQTPPSFRAELIGGVVYVSSPLKPRHGVPHITLGTLFGTYALRTPGVEASDNTTLLLGEEGEPHPDLYLRILAECGGQSRVTADGYVKGAPELLGEIAANKHAIDLHGKLDDYRRYGVMEYLVLCVRERQLRWFDLRSDQELAVHDDGIIRALTFPGLWIHVAALLNQNQRLISVLEEGLASPEHAAFVQRLEQARSKQKRKS